MYTHIYLLFSLCLLLLLMLLCVSVCLCVTCLGVFNKTNKWMNNTNINNNADNPAQKKHKYTRTLLSATGYHDSKKIWTISPCFASQRHFHFLSVRLLVHHLSRRVHYFIFFCVFWTVKKYNKDVEKITQHF